MKTVFILLVLVVLTYMVVSKESFGNVNGDDSRAGAKPIQVLNNIYPTCLPKGRYGVGITSDEVVDYFRNCAENSLVPCEMCNEIYKLTKRFPENTEIVDMYNSCLVRNNCRTMEYRKWWTFK